MIWISGQTFVDTDGTYLTDLSVADKTHRMIQNARAILVAGGSSLEKVIFVKVSSRSNQCAEFQLHLKPDKW